MKNYDEITNDLLERRDQFETEQRNRRKVMKRVVTPICCFCLVAILGIGLWQGDFFNSKPPITLDDSTIIGEKDTIDDKDSSENIDLPMITVTDYDDISVGFGYECLMAYQISDLTNANPWSEDAKLTTLPVYKNLYTYDVNGEIPENSDEYTKELLESVLKKTKNMSGIKVDKSIGGMEIDIEFVPEVMLDKKYTFSFNSSFEQLTKVGGLFVDQYKNIIDMKKPTLNIYEGDYNIYGEQLFNMFLYDGAGSLTDKIINYHFNRVYFFPDDYGRLCRIRIQKTDLSHKVGNYPIIDCKEAERLLFDGKYISTVPYTLTKNDSIAKVELVYRNGGTEKYFMPYYRFYVEVKSEIDKNGLKDFGVYYVPAVKSKYISNMPVWDGSFN